MRKILLILGLGLLAAVAVFYFLGRERVEERLGRVARPPALGGDARLEAVVLYFGDPERFAVRPERRTVVTDPSLTARIASCVLELASGSLTGGLPVLPPDTRLRNAYVDPSGLAYLDFERTILGTGSAGDGEEWLAVAAVVRTVCDNYPAVRRVRFMVDGQVVTSLLGNIDLEEPLRPEDFPPGPISP